MSVFVASEARAAGCCRTPGRATDRHCCHVFVLVIITLSVEKHCIFIDPSNCHRTRAAAVVQPAIYGGAGCAPRRRLCSRKNQLRPLPLPVPAGASVFNPINLAVVKRLANYNRALRCKWARVAAWNCTTCVQDFAPGSARLLASYLTKANAPYFDPNKGVTITSQDKVSGGAARRGSGGGQPRRPLMQPPTPLFPSQDGFTLHYDEPLAAVVLTFSSTRG